MWECFSGACNILLLYSQQTVGVALVATAVKAVGLKKSSTAALISPYFRTVDKYR